MRKSVANPLASVKKTAFKLAPRFRRKDWCTWAPDWLPAVGNIGRCGCRLHDMLYAIGGGPLERLRADEQLRTCIRCKARERAKGFWGKVLLGKWRGYLIANAYFCAVRRYGILEFNWRTMWCLAGAQMQEHRGFGELAQGIKTEKAWIEECRNRGIAK